MKIIEVEALKKYKNKINKTEIQRFVLSHRFYKTEMKKQMIVERICNNIQKNIHERSRNQDNSQQQQQVQGLKQLGLYLNRENNKQIFTLFELILEHPRGVTYEPLAKKLKTDIITISHYCCKLKKLRVIDWRYQKQGVVVFPRSSQSSINNNQITYQSTFDQDTFNFQQSLIYKQLSMTENIWVNISSEESLRKGGMTNEEIKRKIMKHSENKMVRRTVGSLSLKYFDKIAQRQGKVFEFRYKNQTQQLKKQIQRKKQQQDKQEKQDIIDEQIQILDNNINLWLRQQFSEFEGDNFLINLINIKFKDYFSSVGGVKQSKRQCTPLKLNRYIRVLNYLQRQGGMRESQLRNLIVNDEKKYNIGIMHKRSLMGILEGLKNIGIIVQKQGYYYAGWIIQSERYKKPEQILYKKIKLDDESISKKIFIEQQQKITKSKRRKKKQDSEEGIKYKKISEKEYRLELLAQILRITMNQHIKSYYRLFIHRLVNDPRKKHAVKYVPQVQVLSLLQSNSTIDVPLSNNIEQFYKDLDLIIEEKGEHEVLQGEIQNELVKYLRKHPTINNSNLRIKYGKNWQNKFQKLKQLGIINISQQGISLCKNDIFLV